MCIRDSFNAALILIFCIIITVSRDCHKIYHMWLFDISCTAVLSFKRYMSFILHSNYFKMFVKQTTQCFNPLSRYIFSYHWHEISFWRELPFSCSNKNSRAWFDDVPIKSKTNTNTQVYINNHPYIKDLTTIWEYCFILVGSV